MSKNKIYSQQPGTSNVQVQSRGYEPVSDSIQLTDLKTITLTYDPDTKKQYVSETFKVTMSEAVEGATIEKTTGPGEISGTLQGDNTTFHVTSSTPGEYTMTVKHATINDCVTEAITIEAKKNIEFTVTPESKKATKDKSFTINVTSDGEVNASMETGTNFQITPASGKTFTVTAKSPEGILDTATDKVKFTGTGYVDNEVELTFRAKDEVSHEIDKNKAKVGESIKITVNGLSEGRVIEAQSSDPKVTPQVSDNVVTLTASEACQGVTITVKGDAANEAYIDQFTETVEFEKALDVITVTLDPVNGETQKGNTITATITGTESQSITAQATNGVTVNPKGGSNNKVFEITSSVATDSVVTFEGPEIETKTASVKFTEAADKPQFSVDDKNLYIKESQLPYSFNVNGLVGTLKAVVSNPLVFKVEVSESTVTLSKAVATFDFKQGYTANIKLSVDGQEDVAVSIFVDPEEALPKMPCDGIKIYGFEDETVYFNAPTKDNDDEITATSLTPTFSDVKVKDVNRIYLNESKATPAGTYSIQVKHSEYQDALVTYICRKRPTPVDPEPGKESEWYDLGKTPNVKIVTTPDTFIKDVFESGELHTDDERLCYVFGYGLGDVTGLLHTFCTYNRDIGVKAPVPVEAVGGRGNRALYDQFLFTLGTDDYYRFRNYFRLIIKVMKRYRENSMNTLLLMRFENGWIGTSEELQQFRSIVAFINKYIDADGQNVTTNGLELPKEFLNNIDMYCLENLHP